jgi:hypothetical protein
MEKLTTEQLIKLLEGFTFKRPVDSLHLHHTFIPTHKTFIKASQSNSNPHSYLQNSMKKSHLNRGFTDIGQHLTLFPDGMWVTGRDFNKIPASITDHNTGGFAVEMIGNFDIEGAVGSVVNPNGYDVLSGPQKEELLKLLKYITVFRKWGVKFHREYATKTCPGNGINKVKLLKEVEEWGEMENNLKVNLGQQMNFQDYHIVNSKYYVSLREVLTLLGYDITKADTVLKQIEAQHK